MNTEEGSFISITRVRHEIGAPESTRKLFVLSSRLKVSAEAFPGSWRSLSRQGRGILKTHLFSPQSWEHFAHPSYGLWPGA